MLSAISDFHASIEVLPCLCHLGVLSLWSSNVQDINLILSYVVLERRKNWDVEMEEAFEELGRGLRVENLLLGPGDPSFQIPIFQSSSVAASMD
jgi:hypothetical protein